MSGGSKAPSKTTTTTVPWAGQQPFLKTGFAEAQKLYDNPNAPSYFPGSTVAPFNPSDIAAQQHALSIAQSMAPQVANAQAGTFNNASTGLNFNLSGAVLDPNTNPYLKAAGNAAIAPIFQNLTDSVLPGIRGGATVAGQYGGSRQGIAEGLATRSADQSASDTLSKIYSTAYGQGLDAQGRALAVAPSIQAMAAAPAQTAAWGTQLESGVGEQQRNMSQNQIDADIARYNYNQTLPYQKLAEFMNSIQGNYGSSTVGTGPTAKSNPLQSVLGGGLGGASLAGMMGVNPVIGGGVGALLSLTGLL